MLFLYSKFKGCHWQDYSPIKRLKILKALENKMAKKQKRTPMPVVINKNLGEGVLGTFEVEGNKQILYISDILIYEHHYRFFALETILHEGRHAHQYKVINEDNLHWYNFSAKRWKKNFQSYYTSTEDETMYAMQEVERDAQKFTIETMKSLSHKYHNEKDFQWTLDNIIGQYEQNTFEAKKKFGFFYKRKINNKINKRFK